MAAKETKLHKTNKHLSNAISYIVLILISIVWLFPFVCIVLQSFRTYNDSSNGGMVNYIVPKQFSLDSYKFLFNVGPNQTKNCDFLTWYLNTFIIALFVTAITTVVIVCVAFTLSRMRFKMRRPLMNIWLVLGMFPGFLTMICLYFLLKAMHLTQEGAVPGLILISIASCAMGYYVCKGYFDTIPKSLDEAAKIDGATYAQILFHVTVPLSKPIIIYTALTAFMGPWCDYIFASYVAFGRTKSYNVAVGLYRWVNTNDYQGYFTRFCAGGVLVAIPVTILFMALQKYYVEGVTGGAVKG